MMSQRDTIAFLKDRVDELKSEVEMWKIDYKLMEHERDQAVHLLQEAEEDLFYWRAQAC